MPDEVIQATRSRYIEAYERLSGRSFAEWPGADGPQERGVSA
jgi:phosphoribosylaminoimidazole-succinocarboxamide synthase